MMIDDPDGRTNNPTPKHGGETVCRVKAVVRPPGAGSSDGIWGQATGGDSPLTPLRPLDLGPGRGERTPGGPAPLFSLFLSGCREMPPC